MTDQHIQAMTKHLLNSSDKAVQAIIHILDQHEFSQEQLAAITEKFFPLLADQD